MRVETKFFRAERQLWDFVLVGTLAWFVATSAQASPGVVLTWSANTDTNVAGYKIYYGTTSHNYTSVLVAGNVTNATVYGIKAGVTYYFAATTYDAAGNESDFSNETSYLLPAAEASLTSAIRTAGQFHFAVSGTAGAKYVVQASTNLVDWVSVQTNTAPFTFTDPDAGSYSQRFYRTFNLE